MGATDEELKALAERVRTAPRSLAFVPYADLLRRAGRVAEAFQVIRAGLKYHPEHVTALVVLARIHLENGQRALALAVLGDCLRLDPENVAAGSLMVELMLGDGRIEPARMLLERLLSSVPGDKELRRLSQLASPPPAAVHGNPDDPFDTLVWAETLVKRGLFGRAARAWGRIAHHHPTDDGTVMRARELAEKARKAEIMRLPGVELGLTRGLLPPPSGDSAVAVWARGWWSE